MADTENIDAENDTENADTDTDSGGGEGLGEGGKKALDTERVARKAAEKAYKESQKSIADLTARVKEFEDRDKSESDKAADRIAELEKAIAERDSSLAKKELESLRSRVANREGKQVPVEGVTGNTEEEMIASADRLLEWRGPGKAPLLNLRQNGGRSGAGAPPDGSTPQQKAAAALRAMRAGK